MKQTIELSRNEKYANKWFEKNGFTYEIVAQTTGSTDWVVEKDGYRDVFHLPVAVRNIETRMKWFANTWDTFVELCQMKELAKAQRA